MTTFSELIVRVEKIVKGATIVDDIPALINQGVNEIAGGMLSNVAQIITPPLPELFATGKVTTLVDAAFVPMPSNFQRSLQFAVSAKGSEIDIANSLTEFFETNPAMNKAGTISEVFEHGKNLYYLNVPAVAEEVTVHYYRLPVDMEEDDNEPDGIPSHLQIALLVNFAAWKAYEIIEDGIEEDTPNTTKYRNFFFDALNTLELSVPDYTRGLELM